MHKHGGDIYQNNIKIDFSTNINLAGIPEGILQAACEGVMQSDRYPDTTAFALRKAISDAISVSEEQIICGNGAADLIFSLVLALKPHKALLPVPSFYEYEQALRAVDCEIVYFPLKEEQGFCLSEDFLAEIREDIDILFLCNPNNPTGQLLDINLLARIVKQCKAKNIRLVVDECFLDFVDNKSEYSLINQCANEKHIFVLKAFTKLYAMPGLRLGYGVCSDAELLNRMKEVSQPWNVSVPAQMAGMAALKEEQYVADSLKIIHRERNYLITKLQELNLEVYGSKANYIFFRSHPRLYDFCLKKGILIRDCSNYEGLEKGYYRIAVKCREENEQLIKVLKEAIFSWQNQL